MNGKNGKLSLVRGKTGPAASNSLPERFAEHRSALLAYLVRVLSSREDAEEIVQETYIKLMSAPLFSRLTGRPADSCSRRD